MLPSHSDLHQPSITNVFDLKLQFDDPVLVVRLWQAALLKKHHFKTWEEVHFGQAVAFGDFIVNCIEILLPTPSPLKYGQCPFLKEESWLTLVETASRHMYLD